MQEAPVIWPNTLVRTEPYRDEEREGTALILGGTVLAVGDEDLALKRAEWLRGVLRSVAAEASGKHGIWGAPEDE